MPRPKVPDDKRQRIAQACDSCKRRKQKVRTFNANSPPLKNNRIIADASSSALVLPEVWLAQRIENMGP